MHLSPSKTKLGWYFIDFFNCCCPFLIESCSKSKVLQLLAIPDLCNYQAIKSPRLNPTPSLQGRTSVLTAIGTCITTWSRLMLADSLLSRIMKITSRSSVRLQSMISHFSFQWSCFRSPTKPGQFWCRREMELRSMTQGGAWHAYSFLVAGTGGTGRWKERVQGRRSGEWFKCPSCWDSILLSSPIFTAFFIFLECITRIPKASEMPFSLSHCWNDIPLVLERKNTPKYRI